MRTGSPSALVVLAVMGVVLASAGCSEDTASGAECGPGTVEIGGVCEAIDGGVADAGGSADGGVAADAGGDAPAPIECGDGTVAVDTDDDGVDDTCVAVEPLVGDCADPLVLPAVIDRDTLLVEGGCFRADADVFVTGRALLAVGAGVTVTFAEGTALRIESGYLSVLGTEASPVVFEGSDGTLWQGVEFAQSAGGEVDEPAPVQTFTLSDGTTTAPVEVHREPRAAADFYGWEPYATSHRTGRPHTGFESVSAAVRLLVHEDTRTDIVSLAIIAGGIPSWSGLFTEEIQVALDDLPADVWVAVVDDPGELIGSRRVDFSLDQTPQGRFRPRHLYDGAVISGFPEDEAWSITINVLPQGDLGDIPAVVAVDPSGEAVPADGFPGSMELTLSSSLETPPEIDGSTRPALNVLDGLTVRNASVGVNVGDDATNLTLSGCTLDGNQVGVQAGTAGVSLRIVDTMFIDNDEAAAVITPMQLNAFGDGVTFDGPQNVFITGGSLTLDRTVPAEVPTVFVDTLTITGSARLRAEDGADLVMARDAEIRVLDGVLDVDDGPVGVRIRGAGAGQSGFWRGLTVASGGEIDLHGAVIRGAGAARSGGDAPAGIVVRDGGVARLIDVVMDEHAGTSVRAESDRALLVADGGSYGGPMELTGGQIGSLYGDIDVNGIVSVGPGTWTGARGEMPGAVRYAVDGQINLAPGSVLELMSGVDVQFAAGSGVRVESGTLLARGESSTPVTLHGTGWRGIAFAGAGPERSELRDVNLSGVTGRGWPEGASAAVNVIDEAVELTLCRVSYVDVDAEVEALAAADLQDCDDNALCTPTGSLACGETTAGCGYGTVLSGGECVATDIVCGAGTSPVDTTDGFECRPNEQACELSEAFDAGTRTCVDIPDGGFECGDGTVETGGVCVPDDACGTDGDCAATDICDDVGGFCRWGCRTDATCGAGRVCDDDLLVCRDGCRADGDCDSGFACDALSAECVNACSEDDDCADGEICFSGACVPTVVTCGPGLFFDAETRTCTRGERLPGSCDTPTELVDDIVADTTLVRDGCYVVNTVISVGGDDGPLLTIEPGVTIVFGDESGLRVDAGGRIVAVGEEDAPISLVGDIDAPGRWFGVTVAQDVSAAANEFEHVVFENAGADWSFRLSRAREAALSIAGTTPWVAVRDCVFRNNAGWGVHVGVNTVLLQELSASSFDGNAFGAVLAPAGTAGALADDLQGLQASDEFVIGGAVVSESATWAPLSFRVDGVVEVEGGGNPVLTLAPGITLSFEPESGILVDDGGSLVAAGTADARVVLRGTSSGPGRWFGVGFGGAAGGTSSLSFVDITDAGEDWSFRSRIGSAAIGIDDSPTLPRVDVSDAELRGNQGYGIEILGSDAGRVTIDRVIFEGNEAGAMLTQANVVGDLGADNTWGAGRVFVAQGPVSTNQTWDAGLPLHFRVIVAVDADLTMEGPAEYLFDESTGIIVNAGGSLAVEGSATAPVEMRSLDDAPGSWHGLAWRGSNASRNLLRGAVIEDAGQDWSFNLANDSEASVTAIQGARLSIEDTIIRRAPEAGIEASDADVELMAVSGTTFDGTGAAAVVHVHAASAFVSQGDPGTSGNDYQGLDVVLSGNIEQDVTWRADVPFIVDSVIDVVDGAVLDVQGGATARFGPSTGLRVYDASVLAGSDTRPARFVGLTGAPGEWYGLAFTEPGPAANLQLRNVELRDYGQDWTFLVSSSELAAININDSASVAFGDVVFGNRGPGAVDVHVAPSTTVFNTCDGTLTYEGGTTTYSGAVSTEAELCGAP